MKGIQKESQSSIACSISKAITQVNFRHGNHFFTGLFYHARRVEAFVENVNARLSLWAVHFTVHKIRVTGLAIPRPFGDPEEGLPTE